MEMDLKNWQEKIKKREWRSSKTNPKSLQDKRNKDKKCVHCQQHNKASHLNQIVVLMYYAALIDIWQSF